MRYEEGDIVKMLDNKHEDEYCLIIAVDTTVKWLQGEPNYHLFNLKNGIYTFGRESYMTRYAQIVE